ncbi:hypothetical protein BDR06DRAFT_971898 [Suillus hirtellus]|nr:hypothetical protein BDR06DRAFT_971898 [Suillus hirtellus]
MINLPNLLYNQSLLINPQLLSWASDHHHPSDCPWKWKLGSRDHIRATKVRQESSYKEVTMHLVGEDQLGNFYYVLLEGLEKSLVIGHKGDIWLLGFMPAMRNHEVTVIAITAFVSSLQIGLIEEAWYGYTAIEKRIWSSQPDIWYLPKAVPLHPGYGHKNPSGG